MDQRQSPASAAQSARLCQRRSGSTVTIYKGNKLGLWCFSAVHGDTNTVWISQRPGERKHPQSIVRPVLASVCRYLEGQFGEIGRRTQERKQVVQATWWLKWW